MTIIEKVKEFFFPKPSDVKTMRDAYRYADSKMRRNSSRVGWK